MPLSETELHRLRQMRDDLDWLNDKLEQPEYRNTPYNHYMVQLRSTGMLVGSVIRQIESGGMR
jgi:hypothetical protein